MKNKIKEIMKSNVINESDKSEENIHLLCDKKIAGCTKALTELYNTMMELNTPKSLAEAKRIWEMYENISSYSPSSQVFKMNVEEDIEAPVDISPSEKDEMVRLAQKSNDKIKFVKEGKEVVYEVVSEYKISDLNDLKKINFNG